MMLMVHPNTITIHCADSKNGRDVSVAEIRRWHQARGFEDIGYHYVVQPSGRVDQGRKIAFQGAHVEGHNRDNIGICLPGKDKFTLPQFVALRELLEELCVKYGIEAGEIYPHAYFDTAIKQGKTCPNIPREVLVAWYNKGNHEDIQSYLVAQGEPVT